MTRAGVPGCQSHAWILPLRVHAGLGIPGATQTYCQSLSQSGGAAGQFLANGHPILVLHPGLSRALCPGQHSQSVPLPDSLQLWASTSPAPPGAFQRQPRAAPAACSSPPAPPAHLSCLQPARLCARAGCCPLKHKAGGSWWQQGWLERGWWLVCPGTGLWPLPLPAPCTPGSKASTYCLQ